MGSDIFSTRQIREAMKQSTGKLVSQAYVNQVKLILETKLNEISEQSLLKLKDDNETRRIQHAKRIKKLDTRHLQP